MTAEEDALRHQDKASRNESFHLQIVDDATGVPITEVLSRRWPKEPLAARPQPEEPEAAMRRESPGGEM